MRLAVRLRDVVLLPLVCLGLAPGCAPLDMSKPIPWLGDDVEPQVPTKVVAIWTDTILRQTDHFPTRGFGGRLMFYNNEGNGAIPVDGSLVVYAFDEHGRGPADTRPDRKFVFPAEQFAEHYSKSSLGHSYSVWLPWDEIGGPQTEVSLIARFVPAEGPVLVGEQTKHILPGRLRPAATDQAQAAPRQRENDTAVRGVSYDAKIVPGGKNSAAGPAEKRLGTYDISVPARFGQGAPKAALKPQPIPEAKTIEQAVRSRAPQVQEVEQDSSGELPPTRFSHSRSPAPVGPSARLTGVRAHWQPRPVRLPSYPRSTPRPGLVPGAG